MEKTRIFGKGGILGKNQGGKMAYKRLKQANGCVIGHPSSSFAKGYGGQVAVIRDLIISD